MDQQLPALMASKSWYAIGWQDWIGVCGTILGLVGIGIAIKQVLDAKGAAERAETAAQAAANAVEQTTSQVRANLRMALFPNLQHAARELDHAIDRKSHRDARSSLERWRYHASQLEGILINEPSVGTNDIKALRTSIAQCSIASQELFNEDKNVLESCRQARKSITNACDAIGRLIGSGITHIQDTPEGKDDG